MLKSNLMTSSMEQVILGSNQAAVSGGVETASFYNPFKALKAASETPENSPTAELATTDNNNNQDTINTANIEATAKETTSAVAAPEQNSGASAAATPAVEVENLGVTATDKQTNTPEETAVAVDRENNFSSPTVENVHTASPTPEATTTTSPPPQEATEVALDLPFPSTEQMGAEIDLTPGSDDIKGAVFTDASQEEIRQQQNQNVGGKQDVVGLLSHLTKSQDEQEGKYQAPQICEIDQKTGAWLGEGCQDEETPISQLENSSDPTDTTENTVKNTPPTTQFDGEKADVSSDDVHVDSQGEEMTTYAPTSSEIEIEEVSLAAGDKTLSESEGENLSAQLSAAPAQRVELEAQLDKEAALAAAPQSALEQQELSPETIASTATIVAEKNQVREQIKPDEAVNPHEQSPDEALERIKKHYREQLAKESREGQILDLLSKLQRADERLLELKHQYTQIETSLRVWE